tara:strand:+ start:1393 stop:2418 length:1026 start_codon:yes stop_codon:yes gene_type:complete
MARDLKSLEKEAKKAVFKAKTLSELDNAYRTYLGKKGALTQILRLVGKMSIKERSKAGKEANALRNSIQGQIEKKSKKLKETEVQKQEQGKRIDVTAPGIRIQKGHVHPLTQVQRQAVEIFGSLGFQVATGPEIESEWYNFDALNIPADHPARDMWDTFWLSHPDTKGNKKERKTLLRTHTSPVQVRYMEQHIPPFRIIVPGKVFRYEATDATHGFELYQLEGLMVGKNVSASDFRAILQEFYRRFFGREAKIRLRPSYFPFVEPGFEVDMSSSAIRGGEWIEMMGAGMVHPNVFQDAGYNPRHWQGFAFGMGLDRLAMMKYQIPDLRLLYNSDISFLRQF